MKIEYWVGKIIFIGIFSIIFWMFMILYIYVIYVYVYIYEYVYFFKYIRVCMCMYNIYRKKYIKWLNSIDLSWCWFIGSV